MHLELLDWPEILSALAALARSERGVAGCRTLPLAGTAEEARRVLAVTDEAAKLLREDVDLPGLSFPEVEPHLAAASKGAALGVEELTAVASLCEIAFGARAFFESRNAETPLLWSIARDLTPREEIAFRVRATFDASGQIRDSVSPALAALKQERDLVAGKAREEIERLMRSEEMEPLLQDTFFTLRGDRYVLPLKASAKSLGLGIVHDTSRTGETVFVEPTPVVQLNNALKVAELGIARETRRILEEISGRVAEAAPALRACLTILARLDLIAAQARLSVAWEGTLPEVLEEPQIDLGNARHPLLALRARRETREVVGNDFRLGPQTRAMLITGPNAGGKTVLLKTVGLAALLCRAGLLPPVAQGSRIGFFDPVLVEIGDRQSVMGDLSTFSAHLQSLAGILEAAGNGRRTLVLVDELMAGTNPEQGAALARAVLERLVELPGLTLVTTHFDSLKALPSHDPRVVNAAMEYDLSRLAPTFRLKQGTPGRSYAFDMARRMGLSPQLIDRARELAGGPSVGLEELIARLEAREAELAREADALARARAEAEAATGEKREATEALARRERELARHSRATPEEAVAEAREAIRAIVRQAQVAGSSQAAEQARQALEETARAATAGLPEEPPPEGEPLGKPKPGDAVYVPRLKSDGVVSRVEKGRKVKVAVGALTFEVGREELRAPRARAGAASRSGRPAPTSLPPPESNEYTLPTGANTLDLRGLRADEAVAEVEKWLDQAAMAGRSPVFLIHGYGTGALRKAVRDYLARSPYVRRWKPGEPPQGGDGVSVVDL